tara:strand:+ start:80 stop:694 length:615 start_codon:yes stop_codon:yes gene_type:complete
MGLEFKTDINGNPIPRVPEGNTQDKGLLHNSKEQIVVPGGTSTLQPLQGFIDYNDTTGGVNLVADTWTTIPNNGAGAFSNDSFKPHGVNEFMDVLNGSIDCKDLVLGDTIIIRNDYKINPNTNNALLEFRYSLGGVGNEYTLETVKGRLDNGSGIDYRFNLGTDLIYMGDVNTRDNPIFLQVKLSTNGTLLNAGSVIQLIKAII